MKRFLVIALSLMLVMTYVVPAAADSEAEAARNAAGAALAGDGVYVEVDDSMSMTVYRIEADGSCTRMTNKPEPIVPTGLAAAIQTAWSNRLPWSVGTGTGATNFNNGSAKLLSDKSGYVTTGTRSTGSVTGNEVAIDDFAVSDFANETNVATYFGPGDRLTVTGKSASANLTRILVIETSYRNPGVVSVASKYRYDGAGTLNIARFVENNYKIYDPLPAGDYIANKREAGLWTQQGATLVWGLDYVVPVFNTMGLNNTTAMDSQRCANSDNVSKNNWFWGENGGLPFNVFWGENVGITIGFATPHMVRSGELPTRGSGIANAHDTAYAWVGWPGKALESGVLTDAGVSYVGVHTGDNYQGSRQYTQAMSYIPNLVINGHELEPDWLAPPDPANYPEDAWMNTWESWGGGESFNPLQSINFVLDGTFDEWGLKYIILDAAWYPRGNGSGSRSPGGTSGMTALQLLEQTQRCGEGGYITIGSKWRDVASYFGLPNETDEDTKAVVRAWNDFMHEHGFKTAAWCMPMSVYLHPGSDTGWSSAIAGSGAVISGRNIQIDTPFTLAHPDYLITANAVEFDPATGQLLPDQPRPQYRRQTGYYPQNGTGELCLGNPRVLDEYTDYFCNLIFGEYGFDGLKIDTQWGTQPCLAIGHGHDGNPNAGFENYALYWKYIYDKAKAILGEDPWMKHCQCGTMMSFFTQNGTNRPITGDPGSSNVRKARYSIRMWKGLYGDNATAVSDHVENFGNRVKSLMGAGYVMESKFWAASTITAAKVKAFQTAVAEGIPSAYYMDMYKFGFEYPEILAYDKPATNTKYYSVFASNAPVSSFTSGSAYAGGGETTMNYTGPAELRGLEPGFLYKITEYYDNTYEAVHQADANGVITLNVNFTESLLLKAVPLDTVYASVSADAESGIERDVEFTVSIRNAEDLLNIALEFEVDSDLLAGKGLVGLNGFTPLGDIFWSFAGGGKWKGTVTLGLPSGSTTGLTSVAAVDVAKFIFAPRGVGDAAFTLTGFTAVGLDGTTVYLDALILGSAVTNIDQRVFSKYDLNRDNVVDALDLGIMLLYCGFDSDSTNWNTLVKVNDSRGKGVTASMCDVNADGVIDMLDLLDLFIHYTK
ncbi:MAG: hypothetical protein FWG42_03495 [Clostridiales bacterium]|nr:hypothetical protein [Clostridiales bacterium]